MMRLNVAAISRTDGLERKSLRDLPRWSAAFSLVPLSIRHQADAGNPPDQGKDVNWSDRNEQCRKDATSRI
jgi:hypothetical protein